MANLPASTDLLEVYRGLVAQGKLSWDEEQVRIVMKVYPIRAHLILHYTFETD